MPEACTNLAERKVWIVFKRTKKPQILLGNTWLIILGSGFSTNSVTHQQIASVWKLGRTINTQRRGEDVTPSEKEEKNSSPAKKNAPEVQKPQEKQQKTATTQGPPATEEANLGYKKAA